MHRDVGEHLAVDLDAGLVEAVDELRVAHALAPRRRVDADDPKAPEVALSVAPIAVGVLTGPHDLLVGEPVARVLAPPVALGLLEDLLLAPLAGDGVGRAGHDLLALARQQRADALLVLGLDPRRHRHAPLPLGRLLLQDVAGVRAAAAELAGSGLAEALLRARMCL